MTHSNLRIDVKTNKSLVLKFRLELMTKKKPPKLIGGVYSVKAMLFSLFLVVALNDKYNKSKDFSFAFLRINR